MLTSSASAIKTSLIEHCSSKSCDNDETAESMQTRVAVYRSMAASHRVDGLASPDIFRLEGVVAARSKLTPGSANGCTSVAAGWLQALLLSIVFALIVCLFRNRVLCTFVEKVSGWLNMMAFSTKRAGQRGGVIFVVFLFCAMWLSGVWGASR